MKLLTLRLAAILSVITLGVLSVAPASNSELGDASDRHAARIESQWTNATDALANRVSRIDRGIVTVAAGYADGQVGVQVPSARGSVTLGIGDVRHGVKVSAHDIREDGLGVRARYTLRNGARGTVGDANGAKAGHPSKIVTTNSNPIVSFQICAGANGRDSYCSRVISSD